MGEHPKGMERTRSLHTTMVQSVISSKVAADTLVHSYKSFNGFVARLTKEESEKMKGMDEVVSYIPNRIHSIQTSRSWDFLSFSENVQRTKEESNVIVGVLETGIWPNSSSFTDGGGGPPPQKWKGRCQNFTCNNKIVGPKYFRLDGDFDKEDIISPIDNLGHGSHTASTAAGNSVSNANLFGLGVGTARGVPSARISMYKVCWKSGCKTADILAGFDAAIMDGVDIICVSLGPRFVTFINYFEDEFAIGAFHAMKRGILTSKSSGNSGPKRSTTTNPAPWIISVAATTIDRKFFSKLQLGNGQIFQGISLNTFSPTEKSYHLIYGGDAPVPGFKGSLARYCRENSLDSAKVKGKIVLCDSYSSSPNVGFASGAAGLIFSSTLTFLTADIFALPAIHINQSDRNSVTSYLKSTRKKSVATRLVEKRYG